MTNFSSIIELNHIPSLSNNIVNNVIDEMDVLLKNISQDLDIDYIKLQEKYSCNINKITNILNGKKRTRRVLPTDLTCLGRKLDGNQCTRARRSGSEYCLSHHKNLPNGRIDDKSYQKKEKGKRGRKKKNFNEDEYISTKREIIGNILYLVDEEKNVYTNNVDNPEWIGIKNDEGGIDYFYKNKN